MPNLHVQLVLAFLFPDSVPTATPALSPSDLSMLDAMCD
jgi:hypothetical protein